MKKKGSKKEVKKRIEKLKKLINHHRYLYHVLDRQEISDTALDSLKHELYKLEQEFPEFISSDSPTQRVAGRPLERFQKVRHKIPMLSIEDVFNEKELKDWEVYLRRLEPEARFEYFAELKIDGFAVSLVYKNGIFAYGATRGDGKTGEDITQNLKTIESIPLNLEIKKKLQEKKLEKIAMNLINERELEIRGEVYMDKKDFERFNRALKEKGEKTYANPRNLAAGSIRQLNPMPVSMRPLKFLAYDIVTNTGELKHSDEHLILSYLGFRIESGRICKNLSDILRFRQNIVQKREKLIFQIDGIVISVNDNALFRKLGVSGKSPRAIRAFKFSPRQATTKILDIKVQIGRTGAATPIAVLEPVEVSGITITRATLHNEDEIKKLDIKIGDTVIVERAGDVIPAVAKVLKELRTGNEKSFFFPRKCPVCTAILKRPEGEAVWRCLNKNCPARKRENLYHFISKKAFNIVGLGPQIIDRLIDENLIMQPPDIFKLKEKDLISLERFAEKSANNIFRSIKKSKKVELANFIYSLGIRHVGEETAADLAEYFGSIDKLIKASKADLESISDIGGVVSESIFQWFFLKNNRNLIKNLLDAGVEILPPNLILKSKKRGALAGKTIVLTGILESLTRMEAHKRIRALGGNPSNSVSRKTNFLVIGREPGTKPEMAKNLGVKIITEKEFLDIID